MQRNRRKSFYGLSVLACLLLLAGCGSETDSTGPRSAKSRAESFTFFKIGKNTLVSGSVRGELEDILGHAAVERRAIVNLMIHRDTFLQENYPTLDRMNRELNSEIGLKVMHPVTRLMYRYARQKGLPYELVEILFAENSKRPILIRIHFKTENPDTLKTLEDKYGPPRHFEWGREMASSRVWEKEGDYLFYAVIPRRGNKVEYRIAIYFTAALEALIKPEKSAQGTKPHAKTGF